MGFSFVINKENVVLYIMRIFLGAGGKKKKTIIMIFYFYFTVFLFFLKKKLFVLAE